jgi:hypothetical protein
MYRACNNAIGLKGCMLHAFLEKAGCFHASPFNICDSKKAIQIEGHLIHFFSYKQYWPGGSYAFE